MRHLPSFFGTNSTGAPYGLVDGRICPCASRSSICAYNSSCSFGLNLYGGLLGGVAPSSILISNSTSRCGGRPLGSFSGNKSAYSFSKSCSCCPYICRCLVAHAFVRLCHWWGFSNWPCFLHDLLFGFLRHSLP